MTMVPYGSGRCAHCAPWLLDCRGSSSGFAKSGPAYVRRMRPADLKDTLGPNLPLKQAPLPLWGVGCQGARKLSRPAAVARQRPKIQGASGAVDPPLGGFARAQCGRAVCTGRTGGTCVRASDGRRPTHSLNSGRTHKPAANVPTIRSSARFLTRT
jgi:hypothetical protein